MRIVITSASVMKWARVNVKNGAAMRMLNAPSKMESEIATAKMDTVEME